MTEYKLAGRNKHGNRLVEYVFWHGSDGNTEGEAKVISMHEGCARSLGKKITRDADKILSMNLF